MNLNIEELPQYNTLLYKVKDTNVAPYKKATVVAIAEDGIKNNVLDLLICQYRNSSGLNAISIANRLCRNAEGVSVLTETTNTVEHQARLSRLIAMLNIAQSSGMVIAFSKTI